MLDRKLIFIAIFLLVVIILFNLRPFHPSILTVMCVPFTYIVVKTFHWMRRGSETSASRHAG